MEKLLNLLNEYEKEKMWEIWMRWTYYDRWFHRWEEWYFYSELQLISKEYWFIQRLVKHFMLDMTKIDARIALSDFNATNRMLMALAISDNPIELLIDCLK